LESIAKENPAFGLWYRRAVRADSWLATGPVPVGQLHCDFSSSLCPAVGDAVCFLEPFMGQGMTMALSGSFLLASFFNGKPGSPDRLRLSVESYGKALKGFYRSRIFLGKILNQCSSPDFLYKALDFFPVLWKNAVSIAFGKKDTGPLLARI
jgi:flavin-dependent dehydrogenase